jgi:hypothetical protein
MHVKVIYIQTVKICIGTSVSDFQEFYSLKLRKWHFFINNDNNMTMYDLQLSRWHCITKYSQATSHVYWLSGEKINVSRTISVLASRVLMYLENQSVSGTGLPEFHVHDGALANGSCWLVSRSCCVRQASWLDTTLCSWHQPTAPIG